MKSVLGFGGICCGLKPLGVDVKLCAGGAKTSVCGGEEDWAAGWGNGGGTVDECFTICNAKELR